LKRGQVAFGEGTPVCEAKTGLGRGNRGGGRESCPEFQGGKHVKEVTV